MIRDYYAAGKLDHLSDELLRDTLSDEARISLDKIHPTFMGGEYLPNYRSEEVEIERIELTSTTSDVISLRARPSGSRIKYKLVDEYATKFLLPQQTSRRPFCLDQLIQFFDSVEHPGADAKLNRFGFMRGTRTSQILIDARRRSNAIRCKFWASAVRSTQLVRFAG